MKMKKILLLTFTFGCTLSRITAADDMGAQSIANNQILMMLQTVNGKISLLQEEFEKMITVLANIIPTLSHQTAITNNMANTQTDVGNLLTTALPTPPPVDTTIDLTTTPITPHDEPEEPEVVAPAIDTTQSLDVIPAPDIVESIPDDVATTQMDDQTMQSSAPLSDASITAPMIDMPTPDSTISSPEVSQPMATVNEAPQEEPEPDYSEMTFNTEIE